MHVMCHQWPDAWNGASAPSKVPGLQHTGSPSSMHNP